MPFQKFREECAGLLKKAGNEAVLETPPKEIPADLAFPCFSLSKEFRKAPQEIAKEIAARLKPGGLIKEIKAEGPYVNFYAGWSKLSKEIISEILKKKENYGKGNAREKVMVEYSSPNTNKPLHVGHLRNDSIGMSVANMLEFSGNEVIRTAIINDRGVHICKSMLAYKKWGGGKTPKNMKSDHFVGDFYVLFEKKLKENPELEKEIQGMLMKWEQGDEETRKLWKKMNKWVLDGMKETYKAFGSKFDFWTYESEIYDKAKPLIEEGTKKGIFFMNEKGDLVAKLEPELPDKVILRADGTSIYITQDMALARMRFEKYGIGKILYVVATEQNLHFRQLFKIFGLLGYRWAKNCRHLGYGLVNLPSGRMKTREGTVVDADDLISELKELAKKEIRKREEKIPEKALEERSLSIALAAIKYFMLKVEPLKDILFDPSKAISFEGDTGPYLQYTHARASSILKKAKKKPRISLKEEEFAIAKKLARFPEIASASASELKPNYVANYLFELAAMFNEYYHTHRVIGSDEEESRLALVSAVKIVLGSGLKLLGITPLEKM